MRIPDSIENCRICLDIGLAKSDTLKSDQKPYVYFNVEKYWKPDKVEVLLIAESPPCNGNQRYFYNPEVTEKRTNLRKEVLSRLHLEKLEDFRKEGYFLIDTIKCRLCKPIKKRMLLYQIAETCSQRFLIEEIRQLKPNTVFILGNTARLTLGKFPEFEELRRQKITSGYEAELSGYHVILCPYPGGQTKKYKDETNHAFEKLRFKERAE